MDENLFPLPFNLHLALICIAFIFFIFQYSRKKRAYQIIMAVSFPTTLLLYLNESNTWRYCVGIIELCLLIAAIVSTIIDRIKRKKLKNAETETEANVQS